MKKISKKRKFKYFFKNKNFVKILKKKNNKMKKISQKLEKMRISLDEIMFKFFYKKNKSRYCYSFKKPKNHFFLPKKKKIQKKNILQKKENLKFFLDFLKF